MCSVIPVCTLSCEEAFDCIGKGCEETVASGKPGIPLAPWQPAFAESGRIKVAWLQI